MAPPQQCDPVTVTPLCQPMAAPQQCAAVALTRLCHPVIAVAVSPLRHPRHRPRWPRPQHWPRPFPRPAPVPAPVRPRPWRNPAGAVLSPSAMSSSWCGARTRSRRRSRPATSCWRGSVPGQGRAGRRRAGPAPSQPPPLPSQQKGVGMHEPLVDAEGFPRADIDLYQVRTARHNIICERGTGTGRGGPSRGRGAGPRPHPAG